MSEQVIEPSGKAAALGLVSRMRDELHSLNSRETELSNRILLLWKTIDGLTSLANLPRHVAEMPTQVRQVFERSLGLTENCASLLRSSSSPLTIGEICSSLNWDKRLQNVQTEDELFAVWQSLKQLSDDGLVQVSQVGGTRKWSWAEPSPTEPNLLAPAAELLSDIELAGTFDSAAIQP